MRVAEEDEPPPGRSSRAASGIQRYGSPQIDAPYSRDDEVERRVGKRHVLGARLDERELEPELRLHRARGLELRRRDVDADRRARRAARARRRSTPCRSRARRRPCPSTSASTPSSASGRCQIPQVISVAAPSVRRARSSGVLRVRLRPELAVARGVVRQGRRGTRARSRARRDSGESEPWTRLFGIASAKSPRSEPGRRRRPGSSRRSSSRATAIAPSPSSTSASVGAGGDEVDELAEERLLAVLGVVLLGERAVDRRAAARRAARSRGARSARGSRRRARARSRPASRGSASARPPSAAESTRARSQRAAAGAVARSRASSSIPGSARRRLDRRLAVRAHLPQRLERRAAARARLLQPRRADRADEEGRLDLGPADRAVQVAPREPLLHRPDLELALTHVLEVLRRPEEHVDERRRRTAARARAASPSPTSHGSSIRRRASL